MSKNEKKEEAGVSVFFSSIGRFISRNWSFICAFFVTFALATAILWYDANTTETFASFSLEKYEVGQIAFEDIVATKSLPEDIQYPVSIEKGERIIKKGFPITEEEYFKLQKMADSPVYVDYRAFCDKVLYLILLSVLWIVLFNPVLLRKKVEIKEVILECILFVIVFFATSFGMKNAIFQNPYTLPVMIPSVFSAFLVAILFGQTSAIFFGSLLALGVLGASSFQIVPTLYTLAVCISSARIVMKIERRIDMVFASIMQAVLSVVFIIFLKVMFNADFNDSVFIFPGLALNSFLSGILVLGFLTPLESIMNTASVFRLMDLSDQNTPILRKLLLTASGTHQHCMMVAQLAENACKEIGANALLARVGAYYHDIGKMEHPEYFTENNIDTANKHTDLNPSLSVSVIKSHIKLGVEKAHQLRLPKSIIDIIAEHHGNSVITYFYNKAKEKDENVIPEDYSYPGNPPASKESAVVMLADVCEAACKSLEKPTAQRLEKFIQDLINKKIESGQLDNSALTFGELTKIRDTFVRILAAYYHGRIKYQNQKDPDATGDSEKDKSASSENKGDKDKSDSSESKSDSENKDTKEAKDTRDGEK
ncbi:MAG: HDIG domain-containing protein [Treponema sp.]|uniref:HD family phosphohydrolase n=1 Tax=Treponema sp. TaxID=166 RepID=UPI0025EE78DD|nr:HDIG domain-containing metalloprotein [Treponema sp.]MBR0495598.1 HDIG domain-containing protein [Treponema sp.]